MKSNRTRLLILLSIPLLCFVFIMAKRDATPLTFRSNSSPKVFSGKIAPDTFEMDKIPYMDLMRMIAKYRDERQEIINNHFNNASSTPYGENFEDSRYYYISLATLEGFIAHIKKQMQTNHIDVDFSGIRIYPIVYPNTGSSAYFTSIPSIYRNHSSIVFAPTYMNASGYAIDFDPDLYMPNPNGAGNVPKTLEMQEGQSVSSFLLATFGYNNDGPYNAQDHVWLCPPPKPCPHGAAINNADIICPDNTCPY